jgi:transposase
LSEVDKKAEREVIGTKSSDLWRGEKWLLHHDNPPAHSSLLIRDFLTKHETTLVPQPPYSPDLAPADFFLFTKLKFVLKGRRFEPVEGLNKIR